MRKILVGALAGLTLIGGQAVAAGASQPLSVGDRVGATVGQARNYQDGIGDWISRNPVLTFAIVATAIAIPIAINNDNDGSKSGGG